MNALRVGKKFFRSLISILFFQILILPNSLIYSDNQSSYDQQINLGESLRKEGDFLNALHAYEEAGRIADSIKQQIIGVYESSIMSWNLGDITGSEQYLKRALSLAEKDRNPEMKIRLDKSIEIHKLYKLGKEYNGKGESEKSIESFKAAITISNELSVEEYKLKNLRLMSLTYYDMNDLKTFNQMNRDALDIAERLNHKKAIGRCSNNIGLYHLEIQDYFKSLNFLDRALSIFKEIDSTYDMANTLDNIGIVLKNIGDYDKSIYYLNQALAIDRVLGNQENVANVLNDLGTAYRNKGLISGEEEFFRTALKYFDEGMDLVKVDNSISRDIELIILNNKGSVYSDLHLYSKALHHFKLGYEKAVQLNNNLYKGMILNNIGIVHSNLGNYEESTRYFQNSIDLAQRIYGDQILWEAYFEYAKTLTAQKKDGLAFDNLKKSISIIENIRTDLNVEELKAKYLGTDKRIEAYHLIIELLVRRQQELGDKEYLKMAFEYLEKAKARAFLDRLKISQIDVAEHIDFKLKNKEKEIERDLSNLHVKLYTTGFTEEKNQSLLQQLQDKEYELASLRRTIRASNPAYADLNFPTIISLEKTQKELIHSDEVFFEYLIGQEKSFGFCITEDDIDTFEIPNKKKLTSLISSYLKVLSDPDSSNFEEGNTLYKYLIEPGLKTHKQRITVIPDDILHFLPFETLISELPTNRWLIQDYIVSYAPSISSLNEIIARKKTISKKGRMDILAIGDPDYTEERSQPSHSDGPNGDNGNGSNHDRLIYSGAEINKILSSFKARKTAALTKENATEEKFKNHPIENYKILHFATHSRIDNDNPSRSYIALTLNHDTADGLLETREIYDLDLNADLITLSACETGLGKFIRGEGIEGMNRAFFYAGTSAILMSLWPVNDQATSQLMDRFYHHLHDSLSIAKSIRKTKLEMIGSEKLSHPYYWAGFIVSGKGNQVIFPKMNILFYLFGILAIVSLIAIYPIIQNQSKSPRIYRHFLNIRVKHLD